MTESAGMNIVYSVFISSIKIRIECYRTLLQLVVLVS